MQILLNTIEKVKEFVEIASKQEGNIDLVSGRHVIDGKSIMGIFSLDLGKPLEVENDTKFDTKVLEKFRV